VFEVLQAQIKSDAKNRKVTLNVQNCNSFIGKLFDKLDAIK